MPLITRRSALRAGGLAAVTAALPLPSARAATAPTFSMALTGLGARGAGGAGSARATTPVLHAPRPFDLLGLGWTGAAPAEVEVRARRVRGGWTPWTPVGLGHVHGPDADEPGAGTAPTSDPVWTGRATALQLRGVGLGAGVRVHFVDAAPGPGLLARALAPRQAPALPGAPRIVPRAAWATAACRPRAVPEDGDVQVAFVHHTVTTNAYGPRDSAAIVRGICLFHRNVRGWNDMGYQLLVDRYGQVFEGRAGGVDAAVIGAQAGGYNAASFGISSLGTFERAGQTEAGLRALAATIAAKMTLHGVPVQGSTRVRSAGGPDSRYRGGALVTLSRVSGHRDADLTGCPGGALYAQLPALREAVAALARPASKLTLRVAAPLLPYGAGVAVSGTLTRPDGTPGAGAELVVERRRGFAFLPVATVRTDAAGAYALALSGSRSVRLRARFAGDGEHAGAVSAAAGVLVVPVLVAQAPAQVAAGSRVALAGTIAPRKAALRVSVERRVGAAWRAVGRPRTVAVRGGRFAVRVRLARAGSYRLRVRFSGDASNPPVEQVVPVEAVAA